MSLASRQALVVASSLVVFLVPNLVGFGVWFLGGSLPTVVRSLSAIMGWVVSFGLSSILFWRLVRTAFGDGDVYR
jgi:hypothetical protein